MSTLVRLHAVCPKCGDKCQTYSYYSSWNTFSGLDLSRVKNICSKCGAKINEEDSEEDFKNCQLTELERDIKCLEKGVQELERIAGLQKDKEQLCH